MSILMTRLAVIRKISEMAPNAGKTSVQKIVYFLQNWLNVPLGYRFKMHYYGPYSDKVDGNLSLGNAMGLVEVTPDVDGYGYHIKPGPFELEHSHDHVLSDEVNGLIAVLADLELSRLELIASTHFIKSIHPDRDKDEIIGMVGRVKPKFHPSEIEKAYDDVFERELNM